MALRTLTVEVCGPESRSPNQAGLWPPATPTHRRRRQGVPGTSRQARPVISVNSGSVMDSLNAERGEWSSKTPDGIGFWPQQACVRLRPFLYFHSSLVLSTRWSLHPSCAHLGTSSQLALRSEEHGEHLFLICVLILMCSAVTVALVLTLGKTVADPCSETNSHWEMEAPVLFNKASTVCLVGVWSGLVQPQCFLLSVILNILWGSLKALE